MPAALSGALPLRRAGSRIALRTDHGCGWFVDLPILWCWTESPPLSFQAPRQNPWVKRGLKGGSATSVKRAPLALWLPSAGFQFGWIGIQQSAAPRHATTPFAVSLPRRTPRDAAAVRRLEASPFGRTIERKRVTVHGAGRSDGDFRPAMWASTVSVT